MQNQQETEYVGAKDDAKPCREKVQAGKEGRYQRKCDFQHQILMNIYKKMYVGTHTNKV